MTGKRHRKYHHSTTVDVEVNVNINIQDVIDEIDDEELRQFAQERGIMGPIAEFTRDYSERAYIALSNGRTSEALALLERCLFQTTPKEVDVKLRLRGAA